MFSNPCAVILALTLIVAIVCHFPHAYSGKRMVSYDFILVGRVMASIVLVIVVVVISIIAEACLSINTVNMFLAIPFFVALTSLVAINIWFVVKEVCELIMAVRDNAIWRYDDQSSRFDKLFKIHKVLSREPLE